MKRYLTTFLFAASLAGLADPAKCDAQWKRLFSRGGINSIYFLDLPGPPRVGFVTGGDSVFFKTTDGGQSWKKISLLHSAVLRFTDFAFKDSLNGWMSVAWTLDTLYKDVFRTSDQGDSWQVVPSPNSLTYDIYYDSKTQGLFTSSIGYQGWSYRSWDEGKTWEPMVGTSDKITAGFAFASPDSGIMAYGIAPSEPLPWFRTFDGGHTWSSCRIDSAAWQPLAISGQTYFALTVMGTVLRTDDTWNTWKVLHQFPWPFSIIHNTEKYPTTGCIRGTLHNLVVQTADGCYRSTDEGLTWSYLCGPVSNIVNEDRFYAKDNFIYCAVEDDSTGISSLWRLDLDSMNSKTPDLSSNFSNGIKQLSLTPGDSVRLVFDSQTDMFPDSVHLVIRFDPDALSYRNSSMPFQWTLTASKSSGLLDLLYINDTKATEGKKYLQPRTLAITFNSTLSKSSTQIFVERTQVLSHQFNSECLGYYAPADTLNLTFTGCGDSTLLNFMQSGKVTFEIVSLRPNPTTGKVHIDLKNKLDFPICAQVINALGVVEKEEAWKTGEITLDVRSLPSGVYYLRLSQADCVQTRKVVVQR